MIQSKTRKKSGSGSLLSFSFRCRDSKSVSVSEPTSDSLEIPPEIFRPPRKVSSDTRITASFSLAERVRDHDEDNKGTTSLCALLFELKELKKSVKAWGSCRRIPVQKEEEELWSYRRQRRSRSMGKVEDSLAIAKETADPLRDFKISMLQMIVEKEIVGSAELRELLQRFLSVNSPTHHDLILLAFSEIWAAVFSGYE